MHSNIASMKKYYFFALFFFGFNFVTQAQENTIIPLSALGIHFSYALFKNPINNTGEDYKTGVAGLSINYQKGLSKYWEFVSTLSGSILDFADRNNVDLGIGNKQLILELDASIRYAFLSNEHTIRPFIQGGLGGSNYV